MEGQNQIRQSKARPVLFQEWRKTMGMNRREFCEAYDIPYQVVRQWELEDRCVPDYLFRLWAYDVKVRSLRQTEEGKN